MGDTIDDVDVDVFRALLTPSGQALVAEVHERAGIESDTALGARLRETHDGDLVAAAVTQNHLRGVAAVKFGSDAARMYFTHDSLAQTTPRRVADHRARRLRAHGATTVVDLGCGLGGDLLAFARAGLAVRGIDHDPVRVEIARANLDALGLDGSVDVGDARSVRIADDEVAFCDPDRRAAGGRVAGLDSLSPSWDLVAELLAGRAVVTVHPGVAHCDIPDGAEAEWVGDAGALVGCTLWGRDITRNAGQHRATLLNDADGDTIVGDPDSDEPHSDEPDPDGPVGGFLLEPDDAVIRAGLTAQLATELGGWLPDSNLDWISTDDAVTTPFARAYAVRRELPFRTAKLRIALADRDIGSVTVLSRGLPVVPAALVAKLRLEGSQAATIALTRVAGADRAFLVEPR